MWCDAKAVSSGDKVEEVIYRDSVVEVGNGLEEEETYTHKASCVVMVVVESGKHKGVEEMSGGDGDHHGHGHGHRGGGGDHGGEGGGEDTCALVVEVKSTCRASCKVVVESGSLGEGEGVECGEGTCELVVEESCTYMASSKVVVVVMSSGKEPLVEVVSEPVVVEMGSGMVPWEVEERNRRSLLIFQMGNRKRLWLMQV